MTATMVQLSGIFLLLMITLGTRSISAKTPKPIGCYHEMKVVRNKDLPNDIIRSENMTPANCIDHCTSKGECVPA